MSTDQISPETPAVEPVWGAPEKTPRHWGLRETATAVGVAAVIAGLGGAAIYAATGGNSHGAGGGPQHAFGPGGTDAMAGGGPGNMPGGPGGAGGMRGPTSLDGASLHGEFVVSDGSGAYTTVLTQTGTVTAISSTSITVRSDDNYSQTYVMPPTPGGTTAPFAVNDQVSVRATRDGQTATVTSIDNPDTTGGPTGPSRRSHN